MRLAQDAEASVRHASKLSAVSATESSDSIDTRPLASAVARYFAKLLAYKDEYEVARLHADPAFAAKLDEQFEGEMRLRFHLAPPLLSKRDAKGQLMKSEYGPWMMKAFGMLQHFKFLRGTAFDPFGYTEERQKERAWIERYETGIQAALKRLDASKDALQARSRLTEAYQALVVLAQVPEHIRGFGHVKERHLKDAMARWDAATARFNDAFRDGADAPPRPVAVSDAVPAASKVVELRRSSSPAG